MTPSSFATTSFHVKPLALGFGPSGYTPLQVLKGYNFYSTSGTNNISFNGVPGNGAGQTIAIVDAYDDPNIASDLAAFDAQFQLAAPPSFSVVNQKGQTTSLPGVDPSGGWEMEEALDVEWAHAIAPGASIVLVEANSAYDSDLNTAVTLAASLPGVSAVSLSWSGGEFSGETYQDSVFTTPSGHQGVTFLAATGDSGSPAGYPAFSPNVVAVGGTSLHLNSNNSYQSESAWSGSGGGVSIQEGEPSYQLSVQSTGLRTVPDVSFLADPNTGVAIYDSFDNPSGPWTQIGGTSLSTPAWAGIVAIINQGRLAAGGTTLNGATQTLPALYSLRSSDFHDITTGNNGTYSAGPGYDVVTGLGTPIATSLVPDMVAYGNTNAPRLVVTAGPSDSAAGASFGFVATVEIGSTVDKAFNGSVTVSLLNNPGGSSLSGPLTVSAVNGVATFSGLSLNKVGAGYTLGVSASGVSSGATPAFSIVAGPAAKIVVTTQPPASIAQNAAFTVAFTIEDANGNVLTGDNADSMTVSFANNVGAATLAGATTVTVKNGVATFANLTVNNLGTGYTLQAQSASLNSAPTNAFAVAVVPHPAPTNIAPSGTVVPASGYDRPTFTWTAATGADHYYLVVFDNTTGATPFVVPNVSGTSYVTTAAQVLTPGHSFTTYVYALSSSNQLNGLGMQTFTLAALAAPTNVTPSVAVVAANGYDKPTLSWSASPGADHYYLVVVDNTTGATPFVVPNVSGTSYATTAAQALTPGHSFTTYVYAMSTNNQGYSLAATQTFALAALAAPTNVTPSGTQSAASGYDKPTFIWTASPGADHYYLVVVDNTTGATPFVVPNVSGTSYATAAAQALTPGHSFTTYVYAMSTNNQGYSLAATQTFALAVLAAPTNVTPSVAVVAANGYDKPTFSWSASPGADHYYLVVVDNTTGATPFVVPNVSGTSYVTTAAQALTPGHSFTTYVYAMSTNSLGYAGATQTFSLAPLAAPTPMSPIGPSAASPSIFVWSQVAGADHYYLYVVDDTTGTAVINIPVVAANSFSPTTPLTSGHQYTWWVGVMSTNNLFGIWSTSQNFTIGGP